MTNSDYQKLFEHSKKIEHLQGIMQLLDWDQETYMPEGASESRSEQVKTLAGLIHREKVSSQISRPLSNLIDLKTGKIKGKDLKTREKHALREYRRDYLIDTALPKKFVEDFAKLSSQSVTLWRDARKANNFKAFAPCLKKLVDANRKKADYIGFERHPYDALLDLYEPGMTEKKTSAVFNPLKKGIGELLKKIMKAPKIDDKPLYGNFPEEKQLKISKFLLEKVGYDFKHGRLDLSTHPFSTAPHPQDSRITTRLDPKYIFSCISTVLHEAGHSLYSMGLPVEQFGSPLGQAISMGIHESQSRFWETRIGQSLPFIQFILPRLQEEFPKQFHHMDSKSCYRMINRVEPSFIRVDADEVTYPLHVILRFELEKALIEGSLEVGDVPHAWNNKMEAILGIRPKTDAEGCLQDVHWAMGAFGYFPTYALGNLYAAQIFTFFSTSHPDWEKRVAKGEFGFIKDFLHQNVYQWGREYRSEDLIQKITGRPFSSDDYLAYLNTKYSKIY
jgi:carboxypeptidase Taq